MMVAVREFVVERYYNVPALFNCVSRGPSRHPFQDAYFLLVNSKLVLTTLSMN